MSAEVCKEMTIRNNLGLHARAAARFVRTLKPFTAKVSVRHNDQEVDGRSVLGLMMLAASKGSAIEVVAQGEDAQEAMDALHALIVTRCFDEEQ